MRTCLIAFCVLFPFIAFAQRPAMMRAGLDGKWDITLVPDDDTRSGGERDIKDVITFKGGKFSSQTFEKRGFEPAAYEEEMHPGGAGNFNAVQTNKSPDLGIAKWSGFVSVAELTGDLVIKKKDGSTLNFSFKGTKE